MSVTDTGSALNFQNVEDPKQIWDLRMTADGITASTVYRFKGLFPPKLTYKDGKWTANGAEARAFLKNKDNLKNLNTRCSNSNYEDQLSCENNSFTWLNYSDSLSDLGVDSVEFQQINNEDNRAYYVEFMKDDVNGQDSVLFWIGRIIDVSFIEPELLDQNGFVSTPSISFSSEVLDANRVSWFTSKEQRYMVPMITLASTEGNPSSLQTTNYLGVRSFLTLVLDTGVTSNQSKKIVVEEQKQSDNLK